MSKRMGRTPLGDPIEMASLRAVLDDDQSNNRVLVGSVKTKHRAS